MQILHGCAVNPCWWPLLTDIVLFNNFYFLFQNKWYFIYKEGKAQQIEVQSVYGPIKNMDQVYQAVFYNEGFYMVLLEADTLKFFTLSAGPDYSQLSFILGVSGVLSKPHRWQVNAATFVAPLQSLYLVAEDENGDQYVSESDHSHCPLTSYLCFPRCLSFNTKTTCTRIEESSNSCLLLSRPSFTTPTVQD